MDALISILVQLRPLASGFGWHRGDGTSLKAWPPAWDGVRLVHELRWMGAETRETSAIPALVPCRPRLGPRFQILAAQFLGGAPVRLRSSSLFAACCAAGRTAPRLPTVPAGGAAPCS